MLKLSQFSVFLTALFLAACGGTSTSVDNTPKAEGDLIAQWDGGPMYASFPSQDPVPVLCLEGDDTICDNFVFEVLDPTVEQVYVSIVPDEEYEAAGDDTDLYVYDDQGNRLAGFTTNDGDARESAVVPVTGSSYYEVRVLPWLVTPGHTFKGTVAAISGQPIDNEHECLELVPTDLGAAGVTDDGSDVELSVYMLMDGVANAAAAELFALAAESYAPIGVKLVLAGTEQVQFTSQASGDLIEETKRHVGGIPPEGADIVGLLTSKQMQTSNADATQVIGQADCIGGIRWDENSFFVATDIRDRQDRDFNGTGLLYYSEAAAEVIAHEIGHLMGAHHHYGNCVEGNLRSAGPNDASPCSLMSPLVNFLSLNFSQFSSVVVRGHAHAHAN